MPDAVIDACCLIDLLASGYPAAILHASGLTWHLPSAVQSEILYRRQYDVAQSGKIDLVPADLSEMISSGRLTVCAPRTPHELDRFIAYATVFRSDGEAMCLALAEAQQWLVATDDRRAIRVAQQAGLTVMSCPELVKRWADLAGPDQSVLKRVLRDIDVLAQFKPNPTMPHYQWWVDQIR